MLRIDDRQTPERQTRARMNGLSCLIRSVLFCSRVHWLSPRQSSAVAREGQGSRKPRNCRMTPSRDGVASRATVGGGGGGPITREHREHHAPRIPAWDLKQSWPHLPSATGSAADGPRGLVRGLRGTTPVRRRRRAESDSTAACGTPLAATRPLHGGWCSVWRCRAVAGCGRGA